MDTPICDFVKKYAESNSLRLHMPGHKGKTFIGLEHLDVTEFDGADSLFNADGIIKTSEDNASTLFNADTFYSTEGSSLCIRAMLFLCHKYAKEKGLNTTILAGRNAHKSFISACALLGIDVEWIYGKDQSYLSCTIDKTLLKKIFSAKKDLPVALYVTNPDYLGNSIDVKGISEVCAEYGVLLIVDNAHGAYTKFLTQSLHPIDLGADMCCDSAHKTLPALTGASYLHVNKNAPSFFKENAKDALSLFASTSPSYLILQSLDLLNAYLSDGYKAKLNKTICLIDDLKSALTEFGYILHGNERLKICLHTSKYGYSGKDFNKILKAHNVTCEFYDNDFLVLMFTTQTSKKDFEYLKKILLSIPKMTSIKNATPRIIRPQKALSIRDAVLSPVETVSVDNANGKILSEVTVSCPPAVPIIVSGEVIDDNVISILKYYGVKSVKVVK